MLELLEYWKEGVLKPICRLWLDPRWRFSNWGRVYNFILCKTDIEFFQLLPLLFWNENITSKCINSCKCLLKLEVFIYVIQKTFLAIFMKSLSTWLYLKKLQFPKPSHTWNAICKCYLWLLKTMLSCAWVSWQGSEWKTWFLIWSTALYWLLTLI